MVINFLFLQDAVQHIENLKVKEIAYEVNFSILESILLCDKLADTVSY